MNRFFLMLGIALAVVSCGNDKIEPNVPPEPTDTIPTPPKERDSIIILTGCDSFPKPIRFDSLPDTTGLAGTKWKLWGILDVATCGLHILKPIDCEECYTLNFITDSIAFGRSASSPAAINIRWEGNGLLEYFADAIKDGDTFRETLIWNRSYVISENEFRIICYIHGTEEKHLIYKNVKS